MALSKGYVPPAYLQLAAELLKPTKQRTYSWLHLQPGQEVLDVGCGPGTDTIPLAQVVGPSGQVVGVDQDTAMLAEADRRAAQAGVSAWVKHQWADAMLLPFDSACFAGCRSERLLLHVVEPAQALAEMVRVTKAGGWIVSLETDAGTLSIDTPDIDLERRLVRCFADQHLHNGYAGRQLYRLFRQQQLGGIAVEMAPTYLTNYALARQLLLLDAVEQKALTAGIVRPDELQRWQTRLAQAEAEGVFFASFSMVLVAGRKP